MPDLHAKLSPSSASRWLTCTASTQLIDTLPASVLALRSGDTTYSIQGTKAHSLAESKAARVLVARGTFTSADLDTWALANGLDPASDEVVEMDEHTDTYVRYIASVLRLHTNAMLFLERRVDTGLPHCWGTADAIVVSGERVDVIDLKYGQGVRVEVEDNPQLLLYGVGALEDYGRVLHDPALVGVHIVQPRMDNISSAQIDADELVAWRDERREAALANFTEGNVQPKFAPSEAACRWCPAKGVCAARKQLVADTVFDPITEEPKDVGALSPAELAELIDLVPQVKAWLNDLDDVAFGLTYQGVTPVPGYKVVRRNGSRYVKDLDRLTAGLTAAGFQLSDLVDYKAKPLGHLEKLVGGRVKLEQLVADALDKKEGSLALVAEDAKGTALTKADEVSELFTTITDEDSE